MIDVVLQLLVFFMLSSTFVVQSSIQIEMPEAEGTNTLEQKDLTITLAYGGGGPSDSGRIYVDEVEVASINELTHILSEKVSEQPDLRVLLRSDTRTETGRLVEVMGVASSVGITRFGIGAEPPDNGP